MVRYADIEMTVLEEEVFSHSSLEMRRGAWHTVALVMSAGSGGPNVRAHERGGWGRALDRPVCLCKACLQASPLPVLESSQPWEGQSLQSQQGPRRQSI